MEHFLFAMIQIPVNRNHLNVGNHYCVYVFSPVEYLSENNVSFSILMAIFSYDRAVLGAE